MSKKQDDYIRRMLPIFAPQGFPEWAGIERTPTALQIEGLQRELGVKPDGYPGPATIAACASLDWKQKIEAVRARGNGLIIIGPRVHEVMVPTHTYMDDFELCTTNYSPRRQVPHQVMTHYDVTWDAQKTHDVLARRGYSTHFCIDGDDAGTIWQFHDPATRYAWHGGYSDESKNMNRGSIGVDLNNPAVPDYLKRDRKNRGRAREIEEVVIHGHAYKLLDYHDEQLASFAELVQILCDVFGIRWRFPQDELGNPIHTTIPGADAFEGIIGHYHATKRKIDPAPLPWGEIIAS